MIREEDYKVMEVLVNGEWVKQDVIKELTDGTCLYLVGSKATGGSYLMGGVVAGESCREIKTTVIEKRVKNIDELTNILLAEGYHPRDRHQWVSPYSTRLFLQKMFDYCGKIPSTYSWNESWLEEVEVDTE